MDPASLGALPVRLLDLGVLGDDMSRQPDLQIFQERDVFLLRGLIIFYFSGKTSFSRRFLSFSPERNVVKQVNRATFLRARNSNCT